jgi:prepilin-type N-terminal cleavage/methylation domain-containing protein/prepilin-type processing-associated H-X9-DG protein
MPEPDREAVMHTHRGFTLIELLVVMVVIAVLAGLLLPALRTVKEAAKSAKCASGLRQMGLACLAYTSDWDGLLPDSKGNGADWATRISPYIEADKNGQDTGWGNFTYRGTVFAACPNAKPTGGPNVGYAMSYVLFSPLSSAGYSNGGGASTAVNSFPLDRITYKSSRLYISERTGDQIIGGAGNIDFKRHGQTANALMCDFHVQSINPTEATYMVSDPSKL